MVTNMLPDSKERLHQIALSFVPGIGPKRGRALLSHFKTATAIFQASARDFARVEGLHDANFKAFRDKDMLLRAEEELAFCEKHGITTLFFTDAVFPKRFMNCEDAPLLLYYKGNADLNTKKVVAVIGTRKNTEYGQRITEEIIAGLEGVKDIIVVSGLALGIDTIAHKTSLKYQIPTVGVVGHSLDRIYPFSNKQLANDMLAEGGLLSEFPSGTGPERQNFPVRNRVVAGMSDVTVIVESEVKGGAMITAYVAHSYGRDVAAVPGRVYDSRSGGPNLLIKRNIAALVQSGEDLLELMNWDKDHIKKTTQQQLFQDLLPEEQQIIDLLREKDSLHTDDLQLATGLSSSRLASILLQLEMRDLIRTLPGKCYRIN
ncbi:MAG: DNA-protecting protein DprA [Sphingobacteriales bacterium]|nr:MAG: DNA-protecting protein DprA [Sphingobacteriales bacterium]